MVVDLDGEVPGFRVDLDRSRVVGRVVLGSPGVGKAGVLIWFARWVVKAVKAVKVQVVDRQCAVTSRVAGSRWNVGSAADPVDRVSVRSRVNADLVLVPSRVRRECAAEPAQTKTTSARAVLKTSAVADGRKVRCAVVLEADRTGPADRGARGVPTGMMTVDVRSSANQSISNRRELRS